MHFPVADSIDGADANFTHTQFERFTQMLSALKGVGIEPEIRHCCNSGATILYPEYALDMVRPGIATYGVLPSEDLRGMIDLRPVMSLRSTIFQIRDFEPNITISYGRTYTTEDPARIAVVASVMQTVSRAAFRATCRSCCMAGACRRSAASAWTCAWSISRACRSKGRDVVTVFGEDGGDSIELTSLANRLGTIPYELMCGINKRIPRIYLNGEDETEVLQYIV